MTRVDPQEFTGAWCVLMKLCFLLAACLVSQSEVPTIEELDRKIIDSRRAIESGTFVLHSVAKDQGVLVEVTKGRHLLGSSIDWGQDLFYLQRWVDSHPEAKGISIVHSSFIDSSI